MKYRLDDLLTIEEFATKMKVKVRTVRDWVARRKIPFTRLERRVYVSAGVVEEILKRNATPAVPISPRSTLAEQGGA
ncbi:MAG TPA: helix-turn-helix domain-containing protein, partial [Planctomycetota bacterium]|nr:helix-turn-helix domain-containing protein [Planctomycetota bacterium]